MTSRIRPRTTMAVAALMIATAACSIDADSAPRDVPVEERGVFGGEATGGEATGSSRIYLLAQTEGEQPILRSVQRDVSGGERAVLEALLSGPNEAEQLTTALPAELELLSVRPRGTVLTVDVNDAFTDLTLDGLRLAVAQIVTTATGIDTVERVRLRIDGENQAWPIRDNELVDRALSSYDYPGLVESSQPPYPAIPSS